MLSVRRESLQQKLHLTVGIAGAQWLLHVVCCTAKTIRVKEVLNKLFICIL